MRLGLQQLCAVEDLEDLDFLPGHTALDGRGCVSWELDGGLTLVLSQRPEASDTRSGPDVKTIVVEEVRTKDGGNR